MHSIPPPNEQVKDLLIEDETAPHTLPQQARQRLQYLAERPVHKRVRTVRLPGQLHKLKRLKIMVNPTTRELNLASGNGGRPLYIVRDRITVLSDQRYAWSESIYQPGGMEAIGSATFVQDRQGNVDGTIDVEGLFFQVRSLGSAGRHAVIELDQAERARRARAAMDKRGPKNDGAATKVTKTAADKQPKASIQPVQTDEKRLPRPRPLPAVLPSSNGHWYSGHPGRPNLAIWATS